MDLFKGKYGNITSIRTGNKMFQMNHYMNTSEGGVTFYGPHMTTRFDNQGMRIGSGLKTGRNTTYFGKYGNVSDRITSIK